MRAPFLILTPACVFLGIGSAAWTTEKIDPLLASLALIGGLAAHISVNAFNEYFDFKSGLDFKTQRTPFSGGSGTLPESPHFERLAFLVAMISLLVIAVIGLYFFVLWGPSQLLWIGLIGLLVIVAYTPWFTGFPLLTLIAPGLGFGTLMVTGTVVALTGELTSSAVVASFVPFFLVNDLLLLNQFPDVGPDQAVGRRHLPIMIGRRSSAWIYGLNLLLAYVSIGIGIALGLFPLTAALGMLTLLLAVPAFLSALRYAEDMDRLTPALGLNVLLNVLTPLLVGVGLFLG
jgi:1,4-dihydroxy-2-naphthoate octaprenyltransferase